MDKEVNLSGRTIECLYHSVMFKFRCHESEYERGKQVPDQLTTSESLLAVKEYMDYLNYTSSSPSSIFVY